MGKVNQTQPGQFALDAFLAQIEPEQRRADAAILIDLFGTISGQPPVLWGPSIIGFGSHHYVFESGREGDTPRIAFSPRKAQLVLYVGASNPDTAALLPRLGKHSTGKGCLYIKKIADIDLELLEQIIKLAWDRRD